MSDPTKRLENIALGYHMLPSTPARLLEVLREFQDDIDAAREEGRKAGIEQAADEAVLHTHRVCRGDAARMRKCPICRTKAEVAADIRALAETKPQENDDDER